MSMVAALVAALCYGIAAVMQAIAVRASSRRTATASKSRLGTVDLSLVVRMLHQWPFIVSLGLDLIGFVAQLVALRQLPLFAAQAIIAGNLAVTAVFAAWLIHLELAWREWLAVAARVLPGFYPHQLIRDPAAYALAAAGIVSFMLYATALEGGSVTVATAAVVLAETTPPAVVGVMFLGDHTRPGLGGLAVLGFSLAIVCAVALARFGETDEEGLTAAQRRRVRQAAESEPTPHTL